MKLGVTTQIKAKLSTDATLFTLINKYGDIAIDLATNYYESLASSIVGQQLSNKVASVIWNRLILLLGGERVNTPSTIKSTSDDIYKGDFQLLPEAILSSQEEKLRSVGLSYAKINYLKSLSQSVVEGTLRLDELPLLDDESVIAMLTKIKGIGRWTAEMFLIFSLGRENVFSLGDGGLYNAVCNLYALEKPSKQQICEISQNWSPYKSIASLYLWKSLDNE